ncbi:MAG: hypothetical protein Q9199_004608 [Rusavskia elegans]
MLLAAVASVLASAAQVMSQQLDPIRNYCARFDHSSQIKYAALYIDGGIQSFIDVDDNGKQTGNVTTAKNISTDALVGKKPRIRGAMQYMVAMGNKGLIVLIGGTEKTVSDTTDRGLGELVGEQSSYTLGMG